MPLRPALIPCLVYENATAAIDFLCTAFGFEKHLVVPGEAEGEIAHAQLTLAGNMIMLNTAKPEGRAVFGMVSPRETGGLVTGCIHVGLDDPDAHHSQAAAAGAAIIAAPHGNDYGGRGYEARDCEGNVWAFSSYDPWA